jgi:hypothetical protein
MVLSEAAGVHADLFLANVGNVPIQLEDPNDALGQGIQVIVVKKEGATLSVRKVDRKDHSERSRATIPPTSFRRYRVDISQFYETSNTGQYEVTLNSDQFLDGSAVFPGCNKVAFKRASDSSIVIENQPCVMAALTVYAETESIFARVMFINLSNTAMRISKWNLLLDSDIMSQIEVTLNGQPQPYLCSMASRLPPTEQDLVLLKQGQPFELSVNLSKCYHFQSSGEYSIVYRSFNLSDELNQRGELIEILSNVETLVASHGTRR